MWKGYRQVHFSETATIFRGPNFANQKTCGNNPRGRVRDLLGFESQVALAVIGKNHAAITQSWHYRWDPAMDERARTGGLVPIGLIDLRIVPLYIEAVIKSFQHKGSSLSSKQGARPVNLGTNTGCAFNWALWMPPSGRMG